VQWLARLCGAILTLALVASVASWEYNRTAFNADYLKQKAEQSHLADQLAAGLPEVLAASSGTPIQTQAALKQALTSQYIQQQLDLILPKLEQYYAEGGQLPQLDWSGLENQIAAAGLPVPPALASTLEQPRTVTAGKLDAPLTGAVHLSKQLQAIAPIVAAVMVGLVLLLARHRRWTTLAGATFVAALGNLVLAGVAYLPPRLISSALSSSVAKPLEPAITGFAEAVTRDQVNVFLWAAGIMAVIAIVFYLVHIALKARHRFAKPAPPKPDANARS
jgi:hypothetical protein